MPINSNYKIIFVHIPKCAGTSVEKFLGMANITNLFSYKPIKATTLKYDKSKFSKEELFNFENVTPQHLTAVELRKILDPDVFNSFYKFSVVRNPYDRLVSEYYYIHETPSEKTKPFRGEGFDVFLETVFKLPEEEQLALFDGHLQLQSNYIVDKDDKILVDEVFKIEDITACEKKLQSIVGTERTLPHSRPTTENEVMKLLSKEQKNFIYSKYEKDFVLLGYDR